MRKINIKNKLNKIFIIFFILFSFLGAKNAQAANLYWYSSQSISFAGEYDLSAGAATLNDCKAAQQLDLKGYYDGIKNQSPLPSWWSTKKITDCKLLAQDPVLNSPNPPTGFTTSNYIKTFKQTYVIPTITCTPPDVLDVPTSTCKPPLSTYWYYATTPESSVAYHCVSGNSSNTCFEGATGEQSCNTERTARITEQVLNGSNNSWAITKCVKFTQHQPPVPGSELGVSFEDLATAALSTPNLPDKWWYEFASGDNYSNYTVETPGGFSSLKACEDEVISLFTTDTVGATGSGKVLSKVCTKSKTPIAQTPTGANINDISAKVDTNTTYKLLAPLPGLETPINTSDTCAFGNYLNILIKIFIGICAVLAMIMIVVGGLEYMTSELASGKEGGKSRITNAIFGLLLALGAFALLNTLNPQLLEVCPTLPTATVTLDEANFAKTEQLTTSAGTSYKMDGTFASPAPSAGVLDFKNNYLNKGYALESITVDTSAKLATFSSKNGTTYKSLAVNINTGYNGVSEIGAAQGGDGKTPKGTTAITSNRRPLPAPPIEGKAALTNDGKYNMGAAFIDIGATTLDGKARGIGFHGKADNTLSTTNGCIRMYNDDLVVLAPYMITGLKVIIK